MGVDDIIERNRVAAGLKPRDMTIARKNALASDAVEGQQGEYDDEEAAIGSRVYLPSRSEEENESNTRHSAGAISAFDPDVHPEEIILDLDIDTRVNIRNLGWRFALKADIARQMRGNGAKAGTAGTAGTAEPLSVSDITSEDLVLESVIMDKNGEPTERWTISGSQWTGDYPTRFPDGWLSEMLVYPDDVPIAPSEMVDEMRKIRKPLNWVLAIITLIERYTRRKMKSPVEGDNVAMAENLRNIETNAKETERVSGEIGRAKREGNVAEEERLKVQMTRLTDERVKLDSIRREMEHDTAVSILPITPEFSSSSAPAGEVDAAQLRGAVASFNAKMLDKYGERDEEIPESYGNSPRTPRSPSAVIDRPYPEYSSMFEGGGQRGGRESGNKFIPQIPLGVLDRYLSSRYGATSSAASSVASSGVSYASGGGGGGGVMMGGGGSNISLPTMNIPIVATMPMAGMMPIQQPTGGTPLQHQMPGAGTAQTAAQAQTGGTPNTDGVKTLSIKL